MYRIALNVAISHRRRLVNRRRYVAEAGVFRVVSSLALGVPWWILWLLITMVGARWLLGIDLYARSPLWIQLSLLVGVAGMAVTVWMVRRLEQRPPPGRRLWGVLDDLAGCRLRRASHELDELARFEAEDGDSTRAPFSLLS